MRCSTQSKSKCPTPPAKSKSLAELVRWYKREKAPDIEESLEFYRSRQMLAEAVRLAALAEDAEGNMHSHQFRVGKKRCGKAATSLLRHLAEIEACETFDELLACVTRHTSRIDRFGPLARYDTALRIGVRLGFRPERIHLHCGTTRGAKALGLDTSGGVVDVSALPAELRNLEPDHVENFLCICKSRLRRFRRANGQLE